MGWLKTKLAPNWHAKAKAYRDETQVQNMTEATASLVRRGILAYERDHGVLEDE